VGEYVRIAGMGKVPPGSGLAVENTGRWIVIFKSDGGFFALNNVCSVENKLGRI
jgi:nitrite reductase/ring-hydroxylating ferredoxin subunit